MARGRKKKGLGDIVENITEATGIKAVVEFFNDGKPCDGCERRKEFLNKSQLFKRKKKVARTFTEDEYNTFGSIKDKSKLVHDEIVFLCETYAQCFNVPMWLPECFNCRGTANSLRQMIKELNIIYDSYEKLI